MQGTLSYPREVCAVKQGSEGLGRGVFAQQRVNLTFVRALNLSVTKQLLAAQRGAGARFCVCFDAAVSIS